jgi:hypothetical protein
MYASATWTGLRVFQASSAMRTFCAADAASNGGSGGRLTGSHLDGSNQACTASSTLAVSVCMSKRTTLPPRTVHTWAKAAESERPVFLNVPE